MRKSNREIIDINQKLEIIKKCDVLRLAFFDENYPYIIPVNFGFIYEDEKLCIYIHGAKIGKKIDLIKKCNKVAFECDCSHNLITAENACDFTMEYESVCGFGDVEFLQGDDKIKALKIIMKHYSDKSSFEFNLKIVEMTEIFKLNVKEFTAKKLIKK
jgi:hypothetical protein